VTSITNLAPNARWIKSALHASLAMFWTKADARSFATRTSLRLEVGATRVLQAVVSANRKARAQSVLMTMSWSMEYV
jgi:hypothetical protein